MTVTTLPIEDPLTHIKNLRTRSFIAELGLDPNNIWADPEPYYDPDTGLLHYWTPVRDQDGNPLWHPEPEGFPYADHRTQPVPDSVTVPAWFL